MHAISSVFTSRELLWNLTLRELRTKYRRSVLGWTWSLVHPLAMVATYGFVFGMVFRAAPPIGDPSGINNFALFLVAGLIPWTFFSLINNLGLTSISANSGLVKRVGFPREVLVFSNVLYATIQFGIEIGLIVTIMLVAGSPLLLWIPLILLLSVLLMLFGAGFALALSAISIYFRDVAHLWGIVLHVWFFATPIVYPITLVEDRISGSESISNWVLTLYKLNPMHLFTDSFRETVYHGRPISLMVLLQLAGFSLISLSFGWVIFSKLAPRFAEEL